MARKIIRASKYHFQNLEKCLEIFCFLLSFAALGFSLTWSSTDDASLLPDLELVARVVIGSC